MFFVSSLLAIALLGQISDQTPTLERLASIAFLKTLQVESGGFVAKHAPNAAAPLPSLRTTRTALRAFRMLEGNPTDLPGVERFVMSCYDPKSGGFSDHPDKAPDAISTAVGLMALQELQLPLSPYVDRAVLFMGQNAKGFEEIRMAAAGLEAVHRSVPQSEEWLKQIDAQKNTGGSFGTGLGRARMTALSIVATIRLGKKPENVDEVIAVLREGQREDGGFGGDQTEASDLESCYRVMRAFAKLHSLPNGVERLMGFVEQCRNPDGGYGVRPNEPSTVQATYYASIVRQFAMNRNWNFDLEPAGSIPPGWTISRSLDGPGSEWTITRSEDNNMVLSQTSTKGAKKQYNLCVSNAVFKDVLLSVRLKPKSGSIDQGGGLVWRYKDERNYHIARWNPLEDNLRLYKVVDGIRSQLDTVKLKASPIQWHKLQAIHMGRSIRIYFNDQLLLEAEDDQFLDAGRVGLWTKADAVTDFDDLKVRSAEYGDLEDM